MSQKTANPKWTPATIFLVTDHLHHLIVKNYMRRDKAPGTEDDKFERSIHRLHAAIFQAYFDWCNHVAVLPRLPQLEYQDVKSVRGNVLPWEYLLEELALYFLIYSESANVRHMPEALWFIYWIVRNSKKRIETVTGFPADDPRSAAVAARSEAHRGIIRKQTHLRNRYHREIKDLRDQLMVKPDGDYTPDHKLVENKRYALEKLTPLFPQAPLEVALLTDMVVYGDSGAFLNRVVEPIFNYLAVQVDDLGSKGRDIQWRIAYDDCNESLCSKFNVHRILKALGIKFNLKKKVIHFERDPYETLLSVGERTVSITQTDENGNKIAVLPSARFGWGWEDAKNWWGRMVFGKTYVERRSWLTMGRAFFRIWLFLILEFQGMCIFLWAWDKQSSSYPDRWYWLTTMVGTHAAANLLYEVAGGWTQRSTLRGVKLHGNPFW